MVRPDLAGKKIARATAWLDDAESLLSQTSDAFVADIQGRDLAAFYLLLAIQECIDLAAHWIADAGWPPPDDAGSAFDLLADRDAIPRELADSMRAATGLRNRIAHGYTLLDHRRLHTDARSGLLDLRRFLAAVADAAEI
jgi:uncharacterized protein YutE (UPF0331/DUF86 family)